MSERPEKSFAEFFAGIGLMRIDLKNAGWRMLNQMSLKHGAALN